MVERLKELVDNMCIASAKVGEMGGLEPEKVKTVARMELGMFMMYLSASDGEISWDEAKLISQICDLNLTPTTMGDFIRENNIYSTEFEQKVPITLQLMVTADNKLLEAGNETSGSDALISTYETVGKCLINVDGTVDDNEAVDYRIYTQMLAEYRDKNYKGANSSATGFTKNKGTSTSVPTKSGVAAPRKG